ncbi:hypothetical protein F5Y17DRAFT_437608 [Xylariaceae sp. FL0594]|nr:hypothetical protein F5Y17DRAFT_437608 [Xylariaceae sp. FL0594]
MRFSLLSSVLCGASVAVALPSTAKLAPLLTPSGMNHPLVPYEEALKIFANAPKASSNPATYNDTAPLPKQKTSGVDGVSSTAATCASNPNIRFEWDNYSVSDRQALIAAIKCLMNKPPSGNFPPSTSRYEDFARLHQLYANNIHQNGKFLPWHRYFLWSFEQVLRAECGFNRAFVWFDETKHAGNFAGSDIFSAAYLGTDEAGNHCVNNGQFAGLTAHIGFGNGDSPHCLSRNGDPSAQAQCNTNYVNSCLSNSDYKDFERCFEYGPHGYGHNGVGGVMADVNGSPSDPFFWFHHAFVDRAWRVWELADPNNRYSYIDGVDVNGNPLTLDTPIYMGGIRPDTTIREVINTLSGTTICYRYDY